jgi:hypothetical protein
MLPDSTCQFPHHCFWLTPPRRRGGFMECRLTISGKPQCAYLHLSCSDDPAQRSSKYSYILKKCKHMLLHAELRHADFTCYFIIPITVGQRTLLAKIASLLAAYAILHTETYWAHFLSLFSVSDHRYSSQVINNQYPTWLHSFSYPWYGALSR